MFLCATVYIIMIMVNAYLIRYTPASHSCLLLNVVFFSRYPRLNATVLDMRWKYNSIFSERELCL